MAISTLIVYEPLEGFGERISYWEEYSRFYENYWGGPTSPFGVWFGNEYKAFRGALSEHLELDESEIKDCFFIKNDENKYYIAPIGDSKYVFSYENSIPIEWFVLFEEEERKNFYTHWGFNSIHYDAKTEDSISRLDRANKVLRESISRNIKHPISVYINRLHEGINHISNWLHSFNQSGFVVLNYGDICTFIYPHTLPNENSVKEISDSIELIEKQMYDEADTIQKIFFQKWDDIRQKCEGNIDTQLIQ